MRLLIILKLFTGDVHFFWKFFISITHLVIWVVHFLDVWFSFLPSPFLYPTFFPFSLPHSPSLSFFIPSMSHFFPPSLLSSFPLLKSSFSSLHLCQKYSWKRFYHFVDCLLTWLTMSFAVQKLFSFKSFHLPIVGLRICGYENIDQ